jgi:hypothetical protein
MIYALLYKRSYRMCLLECVLDWHQLFTSYLPAICQLFASYLPAIYQLFASYLPTAPFLQAQHEKVKVRSVALLCLDDSDYLLGSFRVYPRHPTMLELPFPKLGNLPHREPHPQHRWYRNYEMAATGSKAMPGRDMRLSQSCGHTRHRRASCLYIEHGD